MAEHNRIGHIGEEKAVDLLQKKGYKILETNWRMGHLEVDIIASYNNEIIFVEVKTRTSSIGRTPEDAVDENKKRHLTAAANAYLKYKKETRNLRFDVVGIIINKDDEIVDIQHYENAFVPSGRYRTNGSFTSGWLWKKRK